MTDYGVKMADKISMVVSQKIGNQITLRSNNINLGHVSKRCTLLSQGNLLNCIPSRIVSNIQNVKTI